MKKTSLANLIMSDAEREQSTTLENGAPPNRQDQKKPPENFSEGSSEPGQPRTPSWTLDTIPFRDFAGKDYRPEWLVRNVIVRNQPLIIGGAKKVLKTSILIDLAISLATGSPLLGTWPVQMPQRVVLLSGESGEFTVQEICKRMCSAKTIPEEHVDLDVGFKLPTLANYTHLDELAKGLVSRKADVFILDPLYLSLMAELEGRPLAMGNLFEVGPLLARIAKACLENNCTPIIAAHARKHLAATEEPIDLDDLAWAGIAEFARQWILIQRREPYQPGTGQHRLLLQAGGSVGHSLLAAVDIDEGVQGEDFKGRTWQVAVSSATEAIQAKKEAKTNAAKERQDAKEEERDRRLLLAVDELVKENPEGAGYTRARNASGLNMRQMERSTFRLKQAGILEETTLTVVAGKGAKQSARGLRRVRANDQWDQQEKYQRDENPTDGSEAHPITGTDGTLRYKGPSPGDRDGLPQEQSREIDAVDG